MSLTVCLWYSSLARQYGDIKNLYVMVLLKSFAMALNFHKAIRSARRLGIAIETQDNKAPECTVLQHNNQLHAVKDKITQEEEYTFLMPQKSIHLKPCYYQATHPLW